MKLALIFFVLTTTLCHAQRKERIEAYEYFHSNLSKRISANGIKYRIDSLFVDTLMKEDLALRNVYLSTRKNHGQRFYIKMVSEDPCDKTLLNFMMNPFENKSLQDIMKQEAHELISPMQ